MNIYKSKTPKANRQVMRTPDGIAEWCAQKFGCKVDLAASPSNKKFRLYFSDHKPMNAEEADGYQGDALLDDWGIRPDVAGFCNPPYADLAPWLQKAGVEAGGGFTSVFLIPSFNGDAWAREVWESAQEVILIEGRINFIKPDGTPLKGNGRGSMLVVFRPTQTRVPAFSYINKRDLVIA